MGFVDLISSYQNTLGTMHDFGFNGQDDLDALYSIRAQSVLASLTGLDWTYCVCASLSDKVIFKTKS